MTWINVKDRAPTKEDSPIVAQREDYFPMVLRYRKHEWDGPGWYDHSDEYGIGLNPHEAFHGDWNMTQWIPLKDLINTQIRAEDD